ncbi:MAG: acetate--CoA ligase family protein [Acidimicrobiales bacterium]
MPLSDAEAERMIDASALAPLLDEQGPGARTALVDLLVRLAALADAVPEIASVRLNPVLVVPGSAAITDVRITLQPAIPDTRPRSAACRCGIGSVPVFATTGEPGHKNAGHRALVGSGAGVRHNWRTWAQEASADAPP